MHFPKQPSSAHRRSGIVRARSPRFLPRVCPLGLVYLNGVAHDLTLLARVAIGLGLAFGIGFERELRGSPAGDRTFALIGTAAAALTAAVGQVSPQAIAGVVTGIGFIGGAVLFHADNTFIRGITTAAAIFATATIGVAAGSGRYGVAVITTVGVLLVLELRHTPLLSRLDARRYAARFRNDFDPPSTAEPHDDTH